LTDSLIPPYVVPEFLRRLRPTALFFLICLPWCRVSLLNFFQSRKESFPSLYCVSLFSSLRALCSNFLPSLPLSLSLIDYSRHSCGPSQKMSSFPSRVAAAFFSLFHSFFSFFLSFPPSFSLFSASVLCPLTHLFSPRLMAFPLRTPFTQTDRSSSLLSPAFFYEKTWMQFLRPFFSPCVPFFPSLRFFLCASFCNWCFLLPRVAITFQRA